MLGILSGILGGLGAIVSVGSAIYTEQQVHQVQSTLKRVVHRQMDELRVLKALAKSVEGIEEHLGVDFFEEEAIRRLQHCDDLARQQLEGWVEGIYALLQHEMHPALLTPEVREEFLGEIENDVKESGSEMVVDIRKDLHDIPISWIVTDSWGIIIILHVPMISDSRTMLRDLYRLDAAVLKRGHEIVRFLSPEPYISVDKFKEYYSVLREEDLHSCRRISGIYMCEEDNVLRRDVTGCTAALFFGHNHTAVAECERQTVSRSTNVLKLNDTTYLISSERQVTIQCPGVDTLTMELMNPPTIVHVDKGCQLRGKDFVIYGSVSRNETINVNHHTLISVDLTEGLPEIEVPTEDTESLRVIERTLDRLEVDAIEDESSMEALDGKYLETLIWIGIGAGAVVVVLVTAICTWSCAKWCPQKQTENVQRPPKGHRDANVAFNIWRQENPSSPGKELSQGIGIPSFFSAPHLVQDAQYPIRPVTPRSRRCHTSLSAGARAWSVDLPCGNGQGNGIEFAHRTLDRVSRELENEGRNVSGSQPFRLPSPSYQEVRTEQEAEGAGTYSPHHIPTQPTQQGRGEGGRSGEQPRGKRRGGRSREQPPMSLSDSEEERKRRRQLY
jgi:hypothetical protein